jgi:Transcriptional Coactivator p15 (PC4)
MLLLLRQFYLKGTEVLPGKKGISLSLGQYQVLKSIIQDGSLDKEIEALQK